jgi:hypothetical protein
VFHTAEAFFDDVTSRTSSTVTGLEIDLDSLKRGIKYVAGHEDVQSLMLVEQSDYVCQKKASSIKGEFREGRQMKVLPNGRKASPKLAREHTNQVAELKKTLVGLLANPSTTLQPKSVSASASKKPPNALASTSTSKTPMKGKEVAVVSAAKSHRKGKFVQPEEDTSMAVESSEGKDARVEIDSIEVKNAMDIVKTACVQQAQDDLKHRRAERKAEQASSIMPIDDSDEEEEAEEEEEVKSRFSLSSVWTLLSTLLMAVCCSVSYTRKTDKAKDRYNTISTMHEAAKRDFLTKGQ